MYFTLFFIFYISKLLITSSCSNRSKSSLIFCLTALSLRHSHNKSCFYYFEDFTRCLLDSPINGRWSDRCVAEYLHKRPIEIEHGIEKEWEGIQHYQVSPLVTAYRKCERFNELDFVENRKCMSWVISIQMTTIASKLLTTAVFSVARATQT